MLFTCREFTAGPYVVRKVSHPRLSITLAELSTTMFHGLGVLLGIRIIASLFGKLIHVSNSGISSDRVRLGESIGKYVWVDADIGGSS